MLLVSEMLDLVEKATSVDGKKSILLENKSSHALLYVLALNYDPRVVFHLPEGAPPYKKEVGKPIGYHQTSIQNELKRFYIWADPNIQLPRLKKESLFSEMLEGMHYTEADIMCAAKDGRLSTLYKSVTEDLVRETFPKLLPPKVVEEVVEKKKSAAKKSSKPVKV
jgi:hypothetical protein